MRPQARNKIMTVRTILFAAALLACGCSAAQQEKVVAATESCSAPKIRVVDESLTTMVLDVCGKRELWMLSLDGRYERVDEPSATLSQR